MISKKIKLWIAQTESWHSFIDFKLPIENKANYTFLVNFEDFYISIYDQLFSLLDEINLIETNDELLAFGKSLEIFSIKSTRQHFRGVNFAQNMLLVAAIYYLAGYSASAYILAKAFKTEDYYNAISVFIHQFLVRDVHKDNHFCKVLGKFMESGNIDFIDSLKESINEGLEQAFQNNPEEYVCYKLASILIKKFAKENIWNQVANGDTLKIGEWNEYIKTKVSKSIPIWSLFPSQTEAIKKGVLKDKKTFSLQMPTSAGKTSICEMLIYYELKSDMKNKVLFLAPFRALASELKFDFCSNLAQLGIKSKVVYGGNISNQYEMSTIEAVDLLISTPEKFMAMESVIPNIYDQFSLIICDEGHLLDDRNRGLSYELLLSKFKDLNSRYKRFIFLSAIIPNIENINDWLGGDENSIVKSQFRPTQLTFAFLKKMITDNKSFLLDVNPMDVYPVNYKLNKFLSKVDFQYINYKTGRINTYNFTREAAKSVAVALKSVELGTVALFTPQKGKQGIKGLSEEVIKQLGLLSLPNPSKFTDKKYIDELKEYLDIILGEEYLLTRLIGYGALFHHGDLPQNVREVIELYLRKGWIRLVICTNTLAEGVNLPIKTLVIHSTKRYNIKLEAWESINVRDLKNIVGRAGRAGKETRGFIIVTNENDFKIMKKVAGENGNEDVNGFLYEVVRAIHVYIIKKNIIIDNSFFEQQSETFLQLLDAIDMSIINLLAEELQVEELIENIKSLIEKTFAFHQLNEEEKKTLRAIFTTRGDALKPYVESGNFKFIKKSGSNLRLYENITKVISFNDEIWTTLTEPISKEWIEYIIGIVYNLPQMQFRIEEFNSINRTNLDDSHIKKIIQLWVEGKWYKEISEEVGFEVDVILKIFSAIINFEMHNIISIVIRIVQNYYELNNIELSDTVVLWPKMLSYGVYDSIQVHLIDLGFDDRIVAIELSNIINETGFEYKSMRTFRRYLARYSEILMRKLSKQIPTISFNKAAENMNFILNKYIF